MKHIVASQQLTTDIISEIFAVADALEHSTETPLQGKILASLFYEPSTRTRFSFESAMLRLGGTVISTESAKEFSSAIKGESLEDSIKVTNNYADVIVLRHPEEGATKKAADVSHVPVINAGDGAGQHPTQALLDVYTIKKECGKINGISIAMVGDLKHGRTIRSLAYLLGKYEDVKIFFVSPHGLRVGSDIKAYLDKHSVQYEEHQEIEPIITSIDVLYQTRIQKERFANPDEYEEHKGTYQIDRTLVEQMKESAILMHPLPRVDEILPEVDASPKAVYFKQTKYGLFIRMALLKRAVLGIE